MITKVVKWGDAKVKLTWKPDAHLPPRNLITSVHGFCFKDGKLLLVNLNHRGGTFLVVILRMEKLLKNV
jgi:8-oxo-dGTP diphosphatase